jgi:hypothetical protein
MKDFDPSELMFREWQAQQGVTLHVNQADQTLVVSCRCRRVYVKVAMELVVHSNVDVIHILNEAVGRLDRSHVCTGVPEAIETKSWEQRSRERKNARRNLRRG